MWSRWHLARWPKFRWSPWARYHEANRLARGGSAGGTSSVTARPEAALPGPLGANPAELPRANCLASRYQSSRRPRSCLRVAELPPGSGARAAIGAASRQVFSYVVAEFAPNCSAKLAA
ncbi:unnamed protein product [Arctogadus glacialis]